MPPVRPARFPLLARILAWFFLNLVLVVLLVGAFFHFEFRLGFDSLLLGQTDERIRAVREVLGPQLSEAPASQWDAILERFSDAYQVRFYLLAEDGHPLAGDPVVLPTEVQRRLAAWGSALPELRGRGWRRGLGGGNGAGPPPRMQRRNLLGDADAPHLGPGPPDRPEILPPPAEDAFRSVPRRPQPYPRFMVRVADPPEFWVGVRIPVATAPSPDNPTWTVRPLTLLARSTTWGGVLFADPVPWLLLGSLIVVLSVVFWLPMVSNITRSLGKVSRVAEQIAEGDLNARVELRRRDELGQLGAAINRMTGRLSGFVNGQRRFLGDVAHELCSPLARCEVALEILKNEAAGKHHARVEDLQEELRHMSALVQELLSYARASLTEEGVDLSELPLRPLVDEVVAREGREDAEIRTSIPSDTLVLAEPELLRRSLGNLVRNAIRYAGKAGPITLSVDREQQQGVMLVVGDLGPGIPEEHLARVFDPFFRLEEARDRESGGAGLGLAIVKTCVESMGGKVHCRNRRPRGLEVALCLQAPGPADAGAPSGTNAKGNPHGPTRQRTTAAATAFQGSNRDGNRL
jgi:two-component system sensor histidine kinase CpxA